MNLFPVNFLVMPHTHETMEMLENLCFDNETVQGYVNYLSAIPTVAVVDKGEFCGFFTKEETSTSVEIHCYIYPSKRKISMKLLRYLRDEIQLSGKHIKTSVFSHFGYIVKVLQILGFKITHIEKDIATKNGKPFDVIYLTT